MSTQSKTRDDGLGTNNLSEVDKRVCQQMGIEPAELATHMRATTASMAQKATTNVLTRVAEGFPRANEEGADLTREEHSVCERMQINPKDFAEFKKNRAQGGKMIKAT